MPIAAASRSYQPGPFISTRVVTLTFSGSYPTGGDTLDLTAITNAKGISAFKQFNFAGVVSVYSLTDTGGYFFEVIYGTTLANFKVKVFTPGGGEHAAAAYNAAVSAPSSPILLAIDSISGK